MMTSNENKCDQKDDLYIASLETFLLARRLQKMSNKVDRNLSTMLLELTETISDFLEKATIEDDEISSKANVNDLIPSVESCVFQAHRMYYCSACNKNIKATGPGLHDHFLSDAHLRHLKHYAKGLPSTNPVNDAMNDAVAKPLDKKKERVNSLLREVGVKDGIPKKLREFIATQDITVFVGQMMRDGLSLQMSGQYQRICQMLNKQLYFRYPQINVYAFGSVVNGLGCRKSDLDIFIDTEKCFYKRFSKRKMKDTIYHVQRILSNFPQLWDNFEPVVHARTPILRAFCTAENIDCDLSFSNGLSTCNTNLISYFMEIQPMSKKIIIFLKYWANSLQLGLNSYLLTLLVIFYLQQENLFPAVKHLQEEIAEVRIDGWNANFVKKTLPQLSMPLATDFKKYLIGFFKFYGFDFDYTNYVICVLTGTRVPKHFFDHGREAQLPPVFKAFADYMSLIDLDEADEVEDLFSNHKPMVIQDPFELIHNVSKGVQEQKLFKIISYFRSTHELLGAAKF